jgi:beta-lactamase regulating signal transducer with metallopeptidase domain/transcriptional regulator NrdR family protein
MFINLFNQEVVEIISQTLISVLWQGAVLSIILALILLSINKHKARVRYIISIVFLFSFALLAVFNSYFIAKEYNEDNLVIQNEAGTYPKIIIDQTINSNSNAIQQSNILHEIGKSTDYIVTYYSQYIFLIWFLGMLIYSSKLLFGLLFIKRLRKTGILISDRFLLQKFQQLKKSMGIKKSVKIATSIKAAVPMVIGYLKPIIIIPSNIVTTLPFDQLELILAHELAHIKRADYLVNIIQSVLEAVFFFHPGVWFISGTIRKEREHCCDDIAINRCEQSINYAKALYNVQNLQLADPYPAVALINNKNQLITRIKRITMKTTKQSRISEKIIVPVIILMGIFMLSVAAKNIPEKQVLAPSTENLETISGINSLDDPPAVPEVSEIAVLPAVPEPPAEAEYPELDFAIPEIPYPATALPDTGNQFGEIIVKTKDQTVIREFYDDKEAKHKTLKIILDKGQVKELYVDGEKIPPKDHDKYEKVVDETLDQLRETKREMERTIQELKEMDEAKLLKEIELAKLEMEKIDMEELKQQLEIALQESEIDAQELQHEVQRAMEELQQADAERILEEAEIAEEVLRGMEIATDIAADISVDIAEESMDRVMRALEEIEIMNTNELEELLRESAIVIDDQRILEEIEYAKLKMGELDMDEMEKILQLNKKKIMYEMEKELDLLEKMEFGEK